MFFKFVRRLVGISVVSAAMVFSLAVAAVADVPAVRAGLEVEDLGAPISRRHVDGARLVYRAPHSDEYHFLLLLTATDGFGDDPEVIMLDINLENGEIRSTLSGSNLRPKQMFLHPNGKIYLTGSRPNALIEYNPETAEARVVGLLSPGFYHGNQSRFLGPDGNLYYGHYGRHISKYNPQTDEIENFGAVDGEGNTYVYNIASDGRYIYCRMSNGWYLAVYDMETGETTVNHEIRGNFHLDDEGYLYWGNHLLVDGVPVPPEEAEEARARAVHNTVEAPEQMTVQEAEERLGFEFDLSDVQPSNWNDGRAIVRWRRGEDDEWRKTEYTGIDVTPNNPRILAATPEGKLMGQGAFYGPVFIFDPDTGESERIGDAPGHAYGLTVTEETAYFASYRSQFWIYNRSEPWELNVNPVNIGGPGIRPNLIAHASDGRVFVAGNHGRHRVGGDLIIYNPADGAKISLRETMEPYSISDMRAMEGGNKIVWSATHREDGTIHFFIFDVEAMEITDVLDVELRATGSMMAIDENGLLGVARITSQNEDGNTINETYIYRLNIDTGEVELEKIVPGLAYTGPTSVDYRNLDRELVKGPDGCGWLCIDHNLTRIHPDGTVEPVMRLTHGARIIFIGDDIYLYGGGRRYWGEVSHIFRIQKVFE